MTGSAEQALRDALAFSESIVDTMRDPLLVLDGDLRVVSAGREFYRTFGVTPEETVGRLVYELGNRQWDIPRLRTLLEEILPQSATFRDFEVEHAFENIGRRVMLLNARRLRREPRDAERILLVIEDVTARRDAEDARREAETRFTEMVKNVRDHSIFLTDGGGVITSWNVAAERILGYAEAEAVGRHFSMIFTPEDLEAGLPDWELRTAREQGRAEDERWHVRKGGERFWALGIVTPLRDANGDLAGYSKILRDITDRKRMEDELRRSRDELEERVRERTAELERSQERALRAERLAAVGQAAAALAHEGRNLLQRAHANLAMLEIQYGGRPEAADLAGRARSALEGLGLLFEDVQGFAAPVVLRKAECDLAAVWREAWAHATAAQPGRDAGLSEDVHVDTRCTADAFRLGQVFRNLFDNALAACPDPARVVVTCRDANPAGTPAVEVRVRDNGPGLSEEQRAKAFEPFFTTKARGTGLGLAICRRIAETHGGTLEATGRAGPGAEFVLTLPRRPAS